jgi:hypothetical protein
MRRFMSGGGGDYFLYIYLAAPIYAPSLGLVLGVWHEESFFSKW